MTFRSMASWAVRVAVLTMAAGCSPAGPGPGGSDGGNDGGGNPNPGCSRCGGSICLSDGGCGQCLGDVDCGGGTPQCDTTTNVCVLCVPGANDKCPAEHYCQASPATCVQGCKSGPSCISGTCSANHECAPCAADGECAAGRICQQGQCSAPCSASNPCAAPGTCCSLHCTNTRLDPFNCGACGVACSGGPFCNGIACTVTGFQNLCAEGSAVVLFDGLQPDNDAGFKLGLALKAGCSGMLWTTVDPGMDAGIDPGSGKPVTGSGTLLVAAGGPFVQKLVAYLEVSASPVYFASDPTNYYFDRRGAGRLATMAKAANTNAHDDFVVQLVMDPSTGTLSLVSYGFNQAGTAASEWYFANTILPRSGTSTASWYVVEWTDTNGNGVPDSADTFTLITSGT
jgi:hypothetical protein